MLRAIAVLNVLAFVAFLLSAGLFSTDLQAAAAGCIGVGLMERGCIGHIPEILDGDSPQTPGGCDAQAWGASELLRVWKKLQNLNS